MAPPGAHVPLRFLRAAIKKGIQLIKHKFSTPTSGRIIAQLQPVLAQNAPTRPIDRIKVGRRWYTTHVRRLLDAAAINPYPAHLTGKVSGRVASHASRTASSAFGTTLRPRLSGGALPRTAGGYSLGGAGARYFSHGAVAPAEVVSQVSSAMRAFLMNGHKAGGDYRRTHGTNGRAGVRAQLAAQLNGDGSGGAAAGGAWVDFDMSPTFTALSHFRGVPSSSATTSLANPATLEMLSHDFATIVSDAAAVLADIKRLATLGDLPVALAHDKPDTIRVHFPSCDKTTVERLCLEAGVTRGIAGEPAAPAARFAFELLMPQLDFSVHHHPGTAPSESAYNNNGGVGVGIMMPAAAMQQSPLDWADMLTPASPSALHESLSQSEEGARWLSELSSIDGAAYFGDACTHASLSPVEDVSSDEDAAAAAMTPSSGGSAHSGGGSGGEARSIYAFLEQCEEYSRGVRGPVWA